MKYSLYTFGKILWGTVFLSSSISHAVTVEKEAYERAITAAKTEYRIATARCKELAGDPKDICSATARGAHKVAEAEAKEKYENTPQNRHNTDLVRAEANYEIAKSNCQTLSGNAKSVCKKEAEAAYVKEKSESKATLIKAEKNQDLQNETAKLQAETDEAAYKVAVEKCDGFSGDTKDNCLEKAKALRP